MSDRRLDQFSPGNSLGGGTCGTVFEVVGEDSLVIKKFNSMAIDRRFLSRNFERLKAMPPVDGMAQVYDFQFDSPPYQALAERIRGEKLPSLAGIKEGAAWKVIRLLSDTLGHAHKHGVFHGHLYPDNILLETEGRVVKPVVTDFGTGIIGDIHHIDLGESALYAAPEQLTGGGSEWVEGRAEKWDVYSFGMIAFWLINERIPRGLNFLKLRNKEMAQSGGRPLAINAAAYVEDIYDSPRVSWGMALGLSREFKLYREIIDRCLALDPADRPVDMREVRNQFRALDHQFAIENAEDRVVKERLKQKTKLFGARALAACLGVFFFLATFYLVNYLRKTYFFRNKVSELDQMVLTQKATIDHLDERWAETVTDLKTSREAADSFFQKMAQGDSAGGSGVASLKRKDLEKSRDYYLKTLDDVEASEETALERGRALHSLAHIEKRLGLPDKSIEHFREAINVFEDNLTPGNLDEEARRDLQLRLADSFENISSLASNPVGPEALGSLQEAVRYFDKILEVRSDDQEVVTRLAGTSFHLGEAYEAHRQYDKAIDAYSRSATLATELRASAGDGSESLTELIGQLQFRAAKSLRLAGRPDESINAHIASMETIEMLRNVNGFTPLQSIQLASSFVELGELFAEKEASLEEIDQLYNESLRLLTPLNIETPSDVEVAILLCRSLSHLGEIEREEGQWSAGYRLSVRGIELLKEALSEEPTDIRGLIVLAETRAIHLGFLEQEKEAAVKIALSGVETSEKVRDLILASTTLREPLRSQVNERLAELLRQYGEICQNLGEAEVSKRCFDEASVLLASAGEEGEGHLVE
ncbi:MAG: tetratricopeptide repeat-containing serine/threonine-protein kinase [Verrucomicrobiales bacterium]|nr:tetratricopeptide repeat-containing serine/threonine-protein kinase [Verrucomicrobiales bacterium]